MNRLTLIQRVRSLTRDLSNAIFREIDIIDYLNEGVDRLRQIIPEFEVMPYLDKSADEPSMLPKSYHHILAVYSASRCFGQDERHYQASTFMNEFETKLDELKTNVEIGRVKILDPVTGIPIVSEYNSTYVTENYFEQRYSSEIDLDEGIEGVE
jgi:hypothetical protein